MLTLAHPSMVYSSCCSSTQQGKPLNAWSFLCKLSVCVCTWVYECVSMCVCVCVCVCVLCCVCAHVQEQREHDHNTHAHDLHVKYITLYSMSIIRHVSLHVNCGYARVNIYENSRQTFTGCLARKAIDTEKRAVFQISVQ